MIVVVFLSSFSCCVFIKSFIIEGNRKPTCKKDDVQLMGFCTEPVKNNEITFTAIELYLDVMSLFK